MSKKKNNIERNVAKKAEKHALKQRLENFMVAACSVVLSLAVVFTVLNNYINSGALYSGTRALILGLMWAGVAMVLVFAVLGAVKKNNKLFKWCAIGAADSVLCFLFIKFGRYRTALISGVAYCYYALLVYLVACIAYYFMALSGAWNKKAARLIYYIIVAAVILAYIVSAVVFMYLSGSFTGFAI